jgi:heat-inducible transcriptional repressor
MIKELPELNKRQKQILAGVVQSFITRAEPVSSKYLAENTHINASSATIRNTMARLESLGLIEQPHTSAGRQPTDLGYRVYINSLIQLEDIRVTEKNLILGELRNIREEQEVLSITAGVLSRITNLLGIAVYAPTGKEIFERINLVPVAEKKLMLILSLSHGLIRSVMLEVDIDIKPRRLQEITQVINEKMSGRPVSLLNTAMANEISASLSSKYEGTIRIFTRSILKLFTISDYNQIQIAGTKNIFHQPEFEKIEDIEGIIEILDNRKTLVHFLQDRKLQDGVCVTIGKEHTLNLFKTHSVITSNFHANGITGTIGVIGPTRMEYSKLISVVDFTAKYLSKL